VHASRCSYPWRLLRNRAGLLGCGVLSAAVLGALMSNDAPGVATVAGDRAGGLASRASRVPWALCGPRFRGWRAGVGGGGA
jgi:hypothetical protein